MPRWSSASITPMAGASAQQQFDERGSRASAGHGSGIGGACGQAIERLAARCRRAFASRGTRDAQHQRGVGDGFGSSSRQTAGVAEQQTVAEVALAPVPAEERAVERAA